MVKKSFLVFIVDVKANECQIKQAVKMLYNLDVAKVNTGSGCVLMLGSKPQLPFETGSKGHGTTIKRMTQPSH